MLLLPLPLSLPAPLPSAVNAQPTASTPSEPQGVTPPTNSSPLLPVDSQGRVESSTLETQATAAKIGAALCAITAVATPFIS